MKQSTIVFLFIFSLLITLITACVDDDSKNGRKLIGITASSKMKATLMLTNFEKGGDSGPAECDGQYHSNEMIIVALPTKWYDHGKKCNDFIGITYNGKNVEAMVIDECDSSDGCPDNVLVASKAVWRALEVPESEWGEIKVTWSF